MRKKLLFCSFTSIILQFEKALPSCIETLLITIAQSKEDLAAMLTFFQNNLSEMSFYTTIKC